MSPDERNLRDAMILCLLAIILACAALLLLPALAPTATSGATAIVLIGGVHARHE